MPNKEFLAISIIQISWVKKNIDDSKVIPHSNPIHDEEKPKEPLPEESKV
jgi:hypothetical protein